MPDITIVGAGPAGTLSAKYLAMSGREVTVLEEHSQPGLPVHCAGVVSPSVLQNIGVRPQIYGSITSADVVLPDGTKIETSKKVPYAFMIDRADLDVKLADKAVAAGADIKYGVHCRNYTVEKDRIIAHTNGIDYSSDLLIGADGQSSLIAAAIGNNQVEFNLLGIQVDLKHRPEERDKMILRLGNEIAPGFFAWQLPIDDDTTRIGLAVKPEHGTPAEHLNALLNSLGLQDAERLATYSGKIPMGGRRVSYADRILLVGDAAGQVKPVSGGGLYPISKVVPILKEAVDRAYSMRLFNSTILALYERGWKREIGKSISNGMRLRRYYDRLSDDDLNTIGHLFAREDIAAELSDIDIDNPGNVVKPILHIKGVKSQILKTYLATRNAGK